MAYSYVEYVGTVGGTTGPFDYGGSVDLLELTVASTEEQLEVYKNATLLTGGVDYTIDEINEEITLTAVLYNTDTLRIRRATKLASRYVDYEDSTNVTSEILDLDSNQLFFLIQELTDLQADAMIRGTDGQWNARGLRIRNLASATEGTDAVNLNQLQAATSGALPANLSGLGTQTYTGDGVETDFVLPAAIDTITDASDVMVHINGIRQLPNTHYIVSSGSVVFSPAPGNGDTILLTWPEGVVSAILTQNSVYTNAIQSGAVTPSKISPGSNGEFLKTAAGAAVWAGIAATDVTGFSAAVTSHKLNEMAAPDASVSLASQKITNLANPSANQDAATKAYVDAKKYSSTHSVAMTGTASSVSFSANTTFQVGQFVLMVPIVQGGNQGYLSVVGIATVGSNASSPVVSIYPDDNSTGRAVFSTTFVRSGGGNINMAYTITRSSVSGVSPDIDLDTSRPCIVSYLRGDT